MALEIAFYGSVALSAGITLYLLATLLLRWSRHERWEDYWKAHNLHYGLALVTWLGTAVVTWFVIQAIAALSAIAASGTP